MQSITQNLEFILGWLKSPYAFWRSESVMPANAGIQVLFLFNCLDSGFRRNDGWRVTFQARK